MRWQGDAEGTYTRAERFLPTGATARVELRCGKDASWVVSFGFQVIGPGYHLVPTPLGKKRIAIPRGG